MKKNKPTILTKSLHNKIVNQAVGEAALLFIACNMERYEWDEDDVIDQFETIMRWTDAIDKDIKIETVQKIIEQHTGCSVHAHSGKKVIP